MSSDKHEVPPSPEASAERVQGRHGDFASLPKSETEQIHAPGAGPQGGLDDGPRMPLVVIALGAAIAFLTLVVGSPWLLGIGGVLVLVGSLWAGIADEHPGSMGGLGTVEHDDS